MLFSAAASAGKKFNEKIDVRVMSQNLYIGADLGRLLAGEPPAAILQTIQQTDFAARAVQIAKAIHDFKPDVIGLQEVSLVELFDSNGNVLLELDYLAILLHELAEKSEYKVAAVVNNADVTLPIDPQAGTFGRLLDRDVILVRTKDNTTSNATSVNFTNNLVVDFGGQPLEFTRGYTAVDVLLKKGESGIRFVNTHLEVEDTPCLTATGPQICQDLQATELVAALANEHLPVVLVGDFNATLGTTAYQTIADSGFLDTWTIGKPPKNDLGYTCCQAEQLTGSDQLFARIDHIFMRERDFDDIDAKIKIAGGSAKRRTKKGLWYSDHRGPWSHLKLKE